MGIKAELGRGACVFKGRGTTLGMTLIEVMVSLAITSLIAMAAAAVMTKTTQVSVQANNEAGATEEISLFNQALHQYIDQSVYFMCNCAGNTGTIANPSCFFDQALADGTTDACDLGRQTAIGVNTPDCSSNAPGAAQTTIVLAAFVTETANNPLEPAGANCYVPAKWRNDVGHEPRGCKKVIQLQYTRPSRQSVNPGEAASQPGVLELRDITAFASSYDSLGYYPLHVTATPYQSIAKLNNVALVRCGLTKEKTALDGHALMNGFQLFSKLKILSRSVIATSKNNEPGVSSYSPSDSNFNSGKAIFRQINENFSLRNIEQRGRTYGPVFSRPCTADNNAASDWRDCCSGHLDANDATKCGGSCIDSGIKPSDVGQCCSHMKSSATGRCL